MKSMESSVSPIHRHPSLEGVSGHLKRAFDIAGSGAGLVLLLPLFGAIALGVRLSGPGPVVYRQKRVGLGGRLFTIFKFRTMRTDAERRLGPVWSVPDDPRCTPLGAKLRRTGLDELPQLWNVLRGEMSLVGPRPERPEFVRRFETEHADYADRHRVRTGLTGFAQAHGWRGDTDIAQRLKHDLHYVERWSLTMDFSVVLMTLARGWSERTRDAVPD